MLMRNHLVNFGIAAFLFSSWSFAQESPLGIWSGSFEVVIDGRRTINVPVRLEITTAENGKLAGKVTRRGGSCQGENSVDGTYEGGKVEVKVAEGAIRGCGNSTIDLSAQGGKLVGKWGARDLVLSK